MPPEPKKVGKQLAEAYEKFCLKYEHPRTMIGDQKKHYEHCREEMMRLSQLFKKYACRSCCCLDFKRRYGQTEGKCLLCGKFQAMTANVQFFHKVKSPSERLFFFESHREGIEFSAKEFSDTVGKSSNVGSELFKKINQVNLNRLRDEKRVTSSSLVEFILVFTYRKKDPRPKRRKKASRSGKAVIFSFSPELQEKLYRSLPEKAVQLSVLASNLNLPYEKVSAGISMLELDGLIDCLPGDFVLKL